RAEDQEKRGPLPQNRTRQVRAPQGVERYLHVANPGPAQVGPLPFAGEPSDAQVPLGALRGPSAPSFLGRGGGAVRRRNWVPPRLSEPRDLGQRNSPER